MINDVRWKLDGSGQESQPVDPNGVGWFGTRLLDDVEGVTCSALPDTGYRPLPQSSQQPAPSPFAFYAFWLHV